MPQNLFKSIVVENALIKDALKKREMKTEFQINCFRIAYIFIETILDIITLYQNKISLFSKKAIPDWMLIATGIITVTLIHKFSTGKKYYPLLKYIAVTVDILIIFIFTYALLFFVDYELPVTNREILILTTVIFIFFNSLNTLRGSSNIVIYSTLLILLCNTFLFLTVGGMNTVIYYCTFFIIILGAFNLWTTRKIILSFINNKKLQLAYEDIKLANEEISAQRDEITTQRDHIEEQHNIVLKQQKQITDSIKYAQRIQKAITTTDDYIKECFPESFVLFLPKDIVSGDFYWFEGSDDAKFFAAVDCTGHGVPGAFMSILGNNFLNQAVNQEKLTKPAEILNFLSKNVYDALKKSTGSMVKDGMDITLGSVNYNTMKLQYAGAHNLFVMVRNGEAKEYTTDIFSIGNAFTDIFTTFTNYEIDVQKGDLIYMFSDGYQDQFGGPYNRKFMKKRLREKFVEIGDYPIQQQKQILYDTFIQWKSSNHQKQVDDVLIIGIKI